MTGDQNAVDERERELLGAAYVLCGLRYPSEQVNKLYQDQDLGSTLEDSTTYQSILGKGVAQGRAEGAIEEARGIVLRLGTVRFGPPPEGVAATIRGITEREQLELMAERLFTATGWDDLLGPP